MPLRGSTLPPVSSKRPKKTGTAKWAAYTPRNRRLFILLPIQDVKKLDDALRELLDTQAEIEANKATLSTLYQAIAASEHQVGRDAGPVVPPATESYHDRVMQPTCMKRILKSFSVNIETRPLDRNTP
jgi:hypothetical protein